jgi:hypothetical protein
MKLTDVDIPAVIFDQRDSSYNAFGDIYLKVHRDYVQKAQELLNTNHEQSDR